MVTKKREENKLLLRADFDTITKSVKVRDNDGHRVEAGPFSEECNDNLCCDTVKADDVGIFEGSVYE